MEKPLNIGHRGGRGLWPENTLYALEQAARLGADGAEIDVQLARDGSLVLFHDFRLKPELCRDARGEWLYAEEGGDLPLIRELTYAELSLLDVGRVRQGTEYAAAHGPLTQRDGEHIPLLKDAIATVRAVNPAFLLFIEIKTSAEDRSLSAAPEAVAEAVIAELRRADFMRSAVLVGFDWPALIHAMRLEPTLPCWFTTKSRPSANGPQLWVGGFDPERFGGSIAPSIAAAGGAGWLCSRHQATPEAIYQARQYGLKFGVWTVNAVEEMRALSASGVDAICTDRPDLLASLKSERSI